MAKSKVVRQTQLLSEKTIKELAELNEWARLKNHVVFIVLVENKPYYILGQDDEDDTIFHVSAMKEDLLENKDDVLKRLISL